MEKDEMSGFEEGDGSREKEGATGTVPRARNRTVLLTPDITTQVRARITHDSESHQSSSNGGFTAVDGNGVPGGFSGALKRSAGEPSAVSARVPATSQPYQPVVEQTTPLSRPAQAPQVAVPVQVVDTIIWTRVTPIVGFLVSYDNDPMGEVFVLRSGRVVITSQEPPGGSYMLLKEESVSPMHAIMRLSENGEVQVLDQLSEFGTTVRHFGSDEDVKLSGDKCTLDHGDILSFGKRTFHICVLAKVQD